MAIEELTDAEFELYRKLIYEKSGISLNHSKKELLRTRLRSRLEREGYPSYRAYLNVVKDDVSGKELVLLLDAISTNLTSFYREVAHFDFLRNALPQMIAEKQAAGNRTFRIWSAGCSSGEEPYTLAFVMIEVLGKALKHWDIKILGTDLSTDILRRAMEGRYEIEKLKDVPRQYRDAYFTQETGDIMTKSGKVLRNKPLARIVPSIREMVTFRRLNLMEHFPFKGKFDFIFCRNVMIYFDKSTQGILVNKFHNYLRDGGYLFIGHSESLTGLAHHFNYVQPTIYKR